jgi:hypothetical protein
LLLIAASTAIIDEIGLHRILRQEQTFELIRKICTDE